MSVELSSKNIESIQFNKEGLLAAIVQNVASGKVLMLGYMNKNALTKTLETRNLHFWSRSRKELWMKGETSGAIHKVERVLYDCDQDAVLVQALPQGPTCHTGKESCFFRDLEGGEHDEDSKSASMFLNHLDKVIGQRITENVEGSYTASLLRQGRQKYLKKINEEAFEVVHAALTESQDRVVSEASDLLFHLMVVLQAEGLSLDHVVQELESRHK